MIFQFDSGYAPGTYYVVEKEVREELLRKELFRLGQFVRESGSEVLEGEPLPESKEDLESKLRQSFQGEEVQAALRGRALGLSQDREFHQRADVDRIAHCATRLSGGVNELPHAIHLPSRPKRQIGARACARRTLR